MRFPFRRASQRREHLLGQMAHLAEAGRRLAIYDQYSGFLAPWYMALRVSEECGRSKRYSRPLSVLVVDAAPGRENEVRTWLAGHLRSTDLTCRHLGKYFVLLAETDEDGASALAMRLLKEVAVAGISCAAFNVDAERFRDLLQPVQDQTAA